MIEKMLAEWQRTRQQKEVSLTNGSCQNMEQYRAVVAELKLIDEFILDLKKIAVGDETSMFEGELD